MLFRRIGVISLVVVFGSALGFCSAFLKPKERQLEEGGVLQFASGFEGTTRVTGNVSTTTSQDGWIEGIDGSLGNWSLLKTGNFPNLDWVKQAYGWFQGGRMEISQDPANSLNKVLKLRNTNAVSGTSRSQWELNQVVFWKDDGLPNSFIQQFYRFRMFIPEDLKNSVLFNLEAPWYMVFESHTWPQFENGNLTRYGIYLQKRSGSDRWYFNAVQSRPEGCHRHYSEPVGCEVYWDNRQNQDVEVPFGEWFVFETFFRYDSEYGEWFVAITREGSEREVVAHYLGPTRFNGEKFHDLMIFKMYHDDWYLSQLNETVQYYDDFEIWNDYPPGYFEDLETETPTATFGPTLTATVSPTSTKTLVPTASLIPTETPSSRPCVKVIWTAVRLREGSTMYNLGNGGNLYQNNEFVPLEIVENKEGTFAKVAEGYDEGWWIALYLKNKPDRIYAEECR